MLDVTFSSYLSVEKQFTVTF